MKRQDGYTLDTTYPPHFYKEMQPVWLASAVKLLGSDAPDITRPYTYCDLGCGVGLSLLVAAATNPRGHFIGVDFNAEHLNIARNAASFMGLKNIEFIQDDFLSFAQHTALTFDFIVCHGVWSWISPVNQASLLNAVQKTLKDHGVFYLHYMCHPGISQIAPLQNLINQLAHHLPGNSAQSVKTGLALLRNLADSGAGIFVDNPNLEASLASLEKQNASYLAHDFLTDHWQPQYSTDVHRQVASSGVTYLGSANVFENLDSLSIPGDVQPIIKNLPLVGLKELAKDMARNQHQRTDLFQKSPVYSSATEHLQRLDEIVFTCLPGAPTTGPLVFKTPIGEIPGPAELFSPLLEQLAQNPASFAELRRFPAFQQDTGLFYQAIQMLMWNGYVHPMRQEHTATEMQVDQLKQWIDANKLTLEPVPHCGTAINPATLKET